MKTQKIVERQLEGQDESENYCVELIPASEKLVEKMIAVAKTRKEFIKEALVRQERKESSRIRLISASDKLIKRMHVLAKAERANSVK